MWYYAYNGKQEGPVTEEALRELVAAGVVTEHTLLWTEAMSDWQPMSALNLKLRLPVSHATAAVFTPLESAERSGVWRDGKTLIMELNAELPHRCIKCNGPAEGEPWKKKLAYNHPAIYLLLLINILILAIVSALTAKRATVYVPVCAQHRAAAKKAILVGWSVFLLSLVSIVLGIVYSSMASLAGFGCLGVLFSIIWGLTKGRLLYPTKIDKEHAWLKGFCPEYLDDLPRL